VRTVLSIARTFGIKNPIGRDLLEKNAFLLKFAPPDSYPLDEKKIIDLIEKVNPDALIIGANPITPSVLDAGTKLKIVAMHGVGLDHVDVNYATKKGIAVTFTPDANTIAVAELVVGLILIISRKLSRASESIRAGKWETILGYELYGKNLGIIGTGKIGKAVIKRLSGFYMNILAHDLARDPELENAGVKYTNMEEIFKESDYLSIHLPLTSETSKLIGNRYLKLMKNTAFIINCSRGAVIDEEALYHVLQSGHIAGAALDVWVNEPPEGISKKLIALENVFPTPHIGAYTLEALYRMGRDCAKSVIDCLEGRQPVYIVNPEVWND